MKKAKQQSRNIREAAAEIDELERTLSRELMGHKASYSQSKQEVQAKAGKGKERYMQMVEKAKEYIVAGDIFQVVLPESFEADFYLPLAYLVRCAT